MTMNEEAYRKGCRDALFPDTKEDYSDKNEEWFHWYKIGYEDMRMELYGEER